jgi:hypothetical protein
MDLPGAEVVRIEIAKLEMKEGDVLVVRIPHLQEFLGLARENSTVIEEWCAEIKKVLGGRGILMFDREVDLAVVSGKATAYRFARQTTEDTTGEQFPPLVTEET